MTDGTGAVQSMRYFVRRARKTSWSKPPPHTDEERASARADFALREGEDGISMFEVANDAHLQTVLAGLACQKYCDDGELKPVDLLELQEAEVIETGAVVPVFGETPLEAANDLHRELQAEEHRIASLVDRLLAAGRMVKRTTRDELRAAITSVTGVQVDDIKRWLEELRASRRRRQ